MRQLPVMFCTSLLGAVMLAGCSYKAGFRSATNTNEAITVSESGQGKNCTAVITVQETVNGKSGKSRQAGVPCSNVAAIKSQLVASRRKASDSAEQMEIAAGLPTDGSGARG